LENNNLILQQECKILDENLNSREQKLKLTEKNNIILTKELERVSENCIKYQVSKLMILFIFRNLMKTFQKL
jgi:hypothetical protein